MNKILLFQTLSLLVISISQQADALKCWQCRSDDLSTPYCNDFFDLRIIFEQQRQWAFVDCKLPPRAQQSYGFHHVNFRPVCKKMIQLIADKVVVSRSCSWEDENSAADRCMYTTTPSYIKTEFCETCVHDGCNGFSKLTVVKGIVLGLTEDNKIMEFLWNSTRNIVPSRVLT